MSNTKLYGFNSYTLPDLVMPVDLTMHMQKSPPVSQLLGMSTLRSFPPKDMSVSSQELHLARSLTPSPTTSLSSYSSGSSLSSYSSHRNTPRKKKNVVFADAKGLPLTSVRIFITDPLETEMEDLPQPEEMLKVRSSKQSGRLRLKLGFPQPIVDRQSLQETLVQLESCIVTERALSGMVRVCNLNIDKAVFVRITFNSWRSHQDIPCKCVREPHAALETDLFAFNVSLPSVLDPKERLEFFVVFRPGNSNLQLLDNNRGKNYQIYVEPHVEPQLVHTANRHNFVSPSPQRPAVRGHNVPRINYLACKSPSTLNRTWGRMVNVAPLC
ncbi:protein phosphatase 1 regulatory subunit 3C-B-like [Xyrauchen texanus]|uniref:protein phosphatase 1 regulatory subunit 3C-B-like n=1 Tax=Xyrauchen texanus TaxID=154827 RepID=UPI002242064D|nr:protein phosphatase 1 regulatory subunit 3C-B-like [Xyrauchen texanus]